MIHVDNCRQLLLSSQCIEFTFYFQDLKIFNIDGSLIDKVGRNLDDYPMKSPRGVALNSKGEIVVSDSSRKCVYVYPIEGAFCEIIWGEVSDWLISLLIKIHPQFDAR